MFTNSGHIGEIVKRHSQMLYGLLKLLKEFRDVTSVNVHAFQYRLRNKFLYQFFRKFCGRTEWMNVDDDGVIFQFQKSRTYCHIDFCQKERYTHDQTYKRFAILQSFTTDNFSVLTRESKF